MSTSNKKTKPSARARKAARATQVPGGKPGESFKNATQLKSAIAARRGQPAGTPLSEQIPARPRVDLKKKADDIIARGKPLKRRIQSDEDDE